MALPVLAKEKAEESIAGMWQLAGIKVNGKSVKDDDLGKRIIVLTEQGIMAAFEDEDAFKSFEPDDAGWYELGEDNKVLFYVDSNENEKLDDQERKRAEVMTWSKDDERLVLTMTVKQGEDEMVVQTILEPYDLNG